MKKQLFLPFLLSTFLSSTGLFCQNFAWAAKAQYAMATGGTELCNDNAGSTYVVGYKRAEGTNQSTYVGSFFNKYTASGALSWSKTSDDIDLSVCMFQNNTVLLTGYDSLGFYFSKYNSSGTLLSKNTIFPGVKVGITSVRAYANNYYLAGAFIDILSIGINTYYNTSGQTQVFLAKFNSVDSCLWVTVSTSGGPKGAELCVDLLGNSYLAGSYYGTLAIGGNTITGPMINGFACKINGAGAVQWLFNINNNYAPASDEEVHAISADNSGNFFVLGLFSNNLTIGASTFTANGLDIFLLKLSSNGSPIWVRQMGGNDTDIPSGVVANSSGDVYVTGVFDTAASFGTVSLTGVSTTTAPGGTSYSREPFFAKYSTNGNTVWAVKAGCVPGAAAETAKISLDQSGSIFVTGRFTGEISFGGNNQTGKGSMFVTKINDYTIEGNSELNEDADFKVFPNPTRDIINITAEANTEIFEIRLYDNFGAIVFDNTSKEETSKIDFSGLPVGIYFLVIDSGGRTKSAKIVRESRE